MLLDDRSGRRIKLHGLRVLQETIATGSMAKAARTLGMTQPAVSYAINEMEQTLGVSLFDRGPQGVLPTAFGEALAQRSVAIFNELRQGLHDIAFLADPAAGEIRIGATPPMSAVAGAAIDRLIRRHPRMSFHLVVEPTESLMRELHRRGIELVVSRMAEPIAPRGTAAEILFYDRLAVIAGKTNPWARKRRLKLASHGWTVGATATCRVPRTDHPLRLRGAGSCPAACSRHALLDLHAGEPRRPGFLPDDPPRDDADRAPPVDGAAGGALRRHQSDRPDETEGPRAQPGCGSVHAGNSGRREVIGPRPRQAGGDVSDDADDAAARRPVRSLTWID